jgi:hypothetical protein
MSKILYHKGQFVGNANIIFIRETYSKTDKKGKQLRYALFQCHCGNQFETRIRHIIMGGTKSCGCKTNEYIRDATIKHGLREHPLYKIWIGIKKRTFNPDTWNYKNYGGRGIFMFPPWIHDFSLFLDYVSALPNYMTQKYSLDRIDNNGNYEPGNLRWTTKHIQSTNKRPRIPSQSGHTDVYKSSPKGHKWYVSINVNNITHRFNGFKTINEAVIARDKFIEDNSLTEYKNIHI